MIDGFDLTWASNKHQGQIIANADASYLNMFADRVFFRHFLQHFLNSSHIYGIVKFPEQPSPCIHLNTKNAFAVFQET